MTNRGALRSRESMSRYRYGKYKTKYLKKGHQFAGTDPSKERLRVQGLNGMVPCLSRYSEEAFFTPHASFEEIVASVDAYFAAVHNEL